MDNVTSITGGGLSGFSTKTPAGWAMIWWWLSVIILLLVLLSL